MTQPRRKQSWSRARDGFGQGLAAEGAAAVEVAAGLRPRVVDGAEEGGGIEGHAGAVAALVHAGHAIMGGDQFLRDAVAGAEFDNEMAATPAAGAGRKIGRQRDGRMTAGRPPGGDGSLLGPKNRGRGLS